VAPDRGLRRCGAAGGARRAGPGPAGPGGERGGDPHPTAKKQRNSRYTHDHRERQYNYIFNPTTIRDVNKCYLQGGGSSKGHHCFLLSPPEERHIFLTNQSESSNDFF